VSVVIGKQFKSAQHPTQIKSFIDILFLMVYPYLGGRRMY